MPVTYDPSRTALYYQTSARTIFKKQQVLSPLELAVESGLTNRLLLNGRMHLWTRHGSCGVLGPVGVPDLVILSGFPEWRGGLRAAATMKQHVFSIEGTRTR